jgi:predicted RNA-binding protein (virulence factor B family)
MTLEIGKTYELTIIKHLEFGVYLDGKNLGEILLPDRYLPVNRAGYEIGEIVSVFIALDSEDRAIATNETPYAEVGDCAFLQVVETTRYGTFLDWGLSKDLLVPYREQRIPMEVGRSYVVYIYLDDSGRLAGSSLLSQHLLEENEDEFRHRQEVDLLICSRSDLGYKAIIDGTHLGLIHNNEITRPIQVGDMFKGYIGEYRPDGKIDITLQKAANEVRHELAEVIIRFLEENGGSSDITDKSAPEVINNVYHASKSNFKKAIGKLYKQRRVEFKDGKVYLCDKK